MRLIIIFVLFLSVSSVVSAQQNDAAKVKYYEQLAGQTLEQLKGVQDENARLAARIAVAERRISELAEANKTLREESALLRKKFESESEARDSQMKKLYAQLEKMVNNISSQSQKNSQSPSPSNGGGASDSGTYEEYIVQSGATLSAIAKAYNVSVSDIKRANSLKGDFLRAGLKLLIPVKK